MIYTFIAERCSDLPVSTCCRVLKVSTSGFYQRRNQPVTNTELAEAYAANEVHDIWKMSWHSYGAPRVRTELRLGRGIRRSKTTCERLMRICGAVGIHYRKRNRGCTRPGDGDTSDDLVNRAFDPEAPDRLWVMDVTEHPTLEGKVYLAVVVDAWSRRVVGWSLSVRVVALITFGPNSAPTPSRWRPGGVNHPEIRWWLIPITDRNTHHGCSVTGSATPACSDRWDQSAIATTTPSLKRSSRSCNASSSTNTTGTPATSSPQRSSSWSKPGTTPAAATATTTGSAHSTTKPQMRHNP